MLCSVWCLQPVNLYEYHESIKKDKAIIENAIIDAAQLATGAQWMLSVRGQMA